MKFVQLLSSDHGMFALADTGDVYVYRGQNTGWSKLNMAIAAPDKAPRPSLMPSWAEEDYPNDDIPF